ncbi:dephospho-CoA kinase [uncultured Umboniibacter sp.]|uniref:dephospho-CoA kinase n=1 Tax=uncultured Umboniibacter sp. TaxID=1798917 RepID=UPI002607537B|nr:dephospho-CoA kinase [uncultured Umboniibacter sp.]
MILGVTGGIGSGKSAATDHLQQLGVTVVDADLCSRVVVQPGRPALQAIFSHFGERLKSADGSLDRAALRQLIFSDPEQKSWLEALLHPLIRNEIQTQLQNADGPYAVLSSPLLFETKQSELCDQVLVIDVDEATQRQRTLSRDGVSEKQVEAIMAAQLQRKKRLDKADYVIDNSGSLEQLHNALQQFHEALIPRDVS